MQGDPLDDEALDLRAYVAVLRRRWRWIAGSIVLAVVVALAVSLQQQPQYQATAEVLIRQRSTESLFTEDGTRNAADAEREVNNQVEQLESGRVRDAVEAVYTGDLDVDDVSAAPTSDRSDAVRISLTGSDPDAVAELVNLYTTTFIDFTRAQRVDDLLAAGGEIQAQIDELQVQVDAASAPLAELDARIAADPEDEDLLAQRAGVAATVEERTAGLRSRLDFYRQQLENLELTAGIAQSGGVQPLTDAEPPVSPVSPKPLRNAALALVLGALLGVGLAFVRERLDDSLRSSDDLDRLTGGEVPTIGVIPAVEDIDGLVVVETDPTSPMSEAYRTLRTTVRFAGIDRRMKVLQVTSSLTGEGKTTTVANLAFTLAQAGQRVVIVCCDFRRPRVHEFYGASLGPGFTDVLLGEVTLSQALRQPRPSVSLFLLAAGSRPPNPSELLGTARAESVIAALAEEFDYVILDSTPILPVTDGLVVSHLADATLVVASARSTRHQHVRQTLTKLRQADAPLLGFVLNRASGGDGGAYGYAYGYTYGEEPPKVERASRQTRRAANHAKEQRDKVSARR